MKNWKLSPSITGGRMSEIEFPSSLERKTIRVLRGMISPFGNVLLGRLLNAGHVVWAYIFIVYFGHTSAAPSTKLALNAHDNSVFPSIKNRASSNWDSKICRASNQGRLQFKARRWRPRPLCKARSFLNCNVCFLAQLLFGVGFYSKQAFIPGNIIKIILKYLQRFLLLTLCVWILSNY